MLKSSVGNSRLNDPYYPTYGTVFKVLSSPLHSPSFLPVVGFGERQALILSGPVVGFLSDT